MFVSSYIVNASRSTVEARAQTQSRAPPMPSRSAFGTTGRTNNNYNNKNNKNNNYNASSSRPNAKNNGNRGKNSVNPGPAFGDGNYYDNYVRNNPKNSNKFTLNKSNHINPFNYHFHQ